MGNQHIIEPQVYRVQGSEFGITHHWGIAGLTSRGLAPRQPFFAVARVLHTFLDPHAFIIFDPYHAHFLPVLHVLQNMSI